MPYVDGFVLPVPVKKLPAYTKLAKQCGKYWRKHGALQYFECVGDDLTPGFGVPFPKLVKPKKGETVVFSFIVYKSKKHRDAVNKKAMSDPALLALCDPKKLPFDCTRMVCGGFKTLAQA